MNRSCSSPRSGQLNSRVTLQSLSAPFDLPRHLFSAAKKRTFQLSPRPHPEADVLDYELAAFAIRSISVASVRLSISHTRRIHRCFMKPLSSACEANRVVSWIDVLGQRVIEFSARCTPEMKNLRSRRLAKLSLGRPVRRTPSRKPLRIHAETKEPRDLSAAGFFVNWSVAQFRDQNDSSPDATLFINFLCFLHTSLHWRSYLPKGRPVSPRSLSCNEIP
jgi:hypothetical protein